MSPNSYDGPETRQGRRAQVQVENAMHNIRSMFGFGGIEPDDRDDYDEAMIQASIAEQMLQLVRHGLIYGFAAGFFAGTMAAVLIVALIGAVT